MVLNEELVLASERSALCVQSLDGESGAVVDERAIDGKRPGVDIDDAELDCLLGQGAAVQAQDEDQCGCRFLDHWVSSFTPLESESCLMPLGIDVLGPPAIDDLALGHHEETLGDAPDQV